MLSVWSGCLHLSMIVDIDCATCVRHVGRGMILVGLRQGVDRVSAVLHPLCELVTLVCHQDAICLHLTRA